MSDAHDWTFDGHHSSWRCKACGWVHAGFVTELPDGPCTCAPSRWVPPGASEPEPAGYMVTPQMLDAGYLPDAGDEYPPEWDELLEMAGRALRDARAEDDALCAVLPQCEVGGCEGTAVASYGGTLVCEEHDPQSKADTETLGLPGLDGGGE